MLEIQTLQASCSKFILNEQRSCKDATCDISAYWGLNSPSDSITFLIVIHMTGIPII